LELGDLLQTPDGHLPHGRIDTLKPKWHKNKTGTLSLTSTDRKSMHGFSIHENFQIMNV
jgi:hypothetical protein